jgi:hypothetical protein
MTMQSEQSAMGDGLQASAEPVRARLLKAALDWFLADQYHKVTR